MRINLRKVSQVIKMRINLRKVSPTKKGQERKQSFSDKILNAYGFLIIFYLMWPILVLMAFSFNSSPFFEFPFPGYTLHWYERMLTDRLLHETLQTSILIGFATVLLTVPIATMLAYAISKFDFRGLSLLYVFILLPIVSPTLLLAVAQMNMFGALGMRFGAVTVALGHTTVFIPFVTLIISSGIYGLKPEILEAAKDLGADDIKTFRTITLPLIRDSVVAGGLFAFVLSFNEFFMSLFLAGSGRGTTFQGFLWSQLQRVVQPDIAAVATMLTLSYIIIILIISRFVKLDKLFPQIN